MVLLFIENTMHLTIVQMLIRNQFPGLLIMMIALFVINILKVI